MNLKLERKRKLSVEPVDAIVLPVFKGAGTRDLTEQYPELEYFIKLQDIKGKPGDELAVFSASLKKLLLVAGAGNGQKAGDAMQLAKKITGLLKKNKIKTALVHFAQDVVPGNGFARVFADALYLSRYSFDSYKKSGKESGKLKNYPYKIQLFCQHSQLFKTSLLKECELVNLGVSAARDMVNEQPSIVNPDFMVKTARDLAVELNLGIDVMRRPELEQHGLPGIRAVGNGSPFEPALIKLTYSPPRPVKTVALVGKAVTFDSGGLNLKPPGPMLEMKSDMGGGAAVLGILATAARLKMPVAIDAYIPVAENMPGGNAYKPGDILTFSNKKSVEIVNTDAEGRLMLADALILASKAKPGMIIEMSTLTGSIANALGEGFAGLMTHDRHLAAMLMKAAENTGERLWRFPLPDDYKESIKGKVADLKNAGYGKASGIKAGLFLNEFTGSVPFAHIDMAGTVFLSRTNGYFLHEGATGFGVRLILNVIGQLWEGKIYPGKNPEWPMPIT